jgi:hypothetical protein
MSENLEIVYDIKAMFTDAYKNSEFNSYAIGTISNLLGAVLDISGMNYNYSNRYLEITVLGDEIPMAVVGKIKTCLSQFIYSCTENNDISEILHMINSNTYNSFCNLIKDQAELFKITNYMYSVLFMGNSSSGHLFRIMM